MTQKTTRDNKMDFPSENQRTRRHSDTASEKRSNSKAIREAPSIISTVSSALGFSRATGPHRSQPDKKSESDKRHDRERSIDLVEVPRSRIKELEDAFADRDRLIEKFDQMKTDHNGQMRSRDDEIKYWKQQADRSYVVLDKMQSERAMLQDQIRIAQEGALRSMRNASWTPMEDGKVRQELTKLEERLRSWAKKNAVAEISSLEDIPTAEKNATVGQLEGYCAAGSWDSLTKRMAPNIAKRSPLILVQALLAKSIFETIISRPFFAFPENNANSGMPSAGQLFSLYNKMIQVNEAEAHTWRSQMLRLLSTAPISSTADPWLSGQIHAMSIRLTREFVAGPVQWLLRRARDDIELEKRDSDLQKLYHSAGELSLSLWTQRTELKCQCLPDMPIFRENDIRLRAHRLHQLDEGDRRLDGRNILIVLQPAILAYGDENAENYEEAKLWARATVVVDESN